MGQKTGRSKKENRVSRRESRMALIPLYQNLNSGNLLTNGLNSSLSDSGRAVGLSVVAISASFSNSPSPIPLMELVSINFGLRNNKKILSK